ncbi:zinc finger protein, partial [Loa loa]
MTDVMRALTIAMNIEKRAAKFTNVKNRIVEKSTIVGHHFTLTRGEIINHINLNLNAKTKSELMSVIMSDVLCARTVPKKIENTRKPTANHLFTNVKNPIVEKSTIVRHHFTLTRRENINHINLKSQCENCNKSFSRKDHLKEHQRDASEIH